MSKRKKHPSELSLQKIRQLQHKNEFAKRLKAFAIAYVGKEAAALLSDHRIEDIYQRRTHTLKLMVAEGSVIMPQDKKYIESYLLHLIKHEKITAPNDTEISFSDYLTVGLSLCFYLDKVKTNLSNADEPFYNAFANYEGLFFSGEDANQRLCSFAEGICFFKNDIGLQHFWINPVLKFKIKDDYTIITYLELNRKVPERTTFTIENQPRPAIKLGWAVPQVGVIYRNVRLSELGVRVHSLDLPFDIYIQAHALQRLSERLDCLPLAFVHFFVIISLSKPHVTSDASGKMLIEYRIDNYKVGYLRADIVNGCILIRTFLFLTNNGTPEGQKLEEMTGLGKLDKKYLAIDKLSAFMSSDIRSNESVMQLLRKSGCACLLDVHEKLKQIINNGNRIQATGALMSKYLELNVTRERELMETSESM